MLALHLNDRDADEFSIPSSELLGYDYVSVKYARAY